MVILLPDSGTRYVSKIYNDEWMRTNGFLDEDQSMKIEEVVRLRGSDIRILVTVNRKESLDDAIRLMNEHNISQLPVTDGEEIVGSLTETQILTQLTKSAGMRNKQVGEVMDKPLPVVSDDLKIDQITRMLSEGSAAVIVRFSDGRHSIVTRSDLINAIAKVSS